jgi:hypothetical protein
VQLLVASCLRGHGRFDKIRQNSTVLGFAQRVQIAWFN